MPCCCWYCSSTTPNTTQTKQHNLHYVDLHTHTQLYIFLFIYLFTLWGQIWTYTDVYISICMNNDDLSFFRPVNHCLTQPLLHTHIRAQTHRHTCMHAYRQTDRHTDRETQRDTERETERERERHRERERETHRHGHRHRHRRRHRHTHTETDRHTDTQTQRQTDTETQTHRHTDIQTYTHTEAYIHISYIHTCIHTCLPTCPPTYIHADIQTYRQRQTDRQAGRQAGRQTDRQADRQAGRQTYIHTRVYTCILQYMFHHAIKWDGSQICDFIPYYTIILFGARDSWSRYHLCIQHPHHFRTPGFDTELRTALPESVRCRGVASSGPMKGDKLLDVGDMISTFDILMGIPLAIKNYDMIFFSYTFTEPLLI